MNAVLTEAEQRLIAAYSQAALLIQRELSTFKSPDDRRRIMEKVNAILSQLDRLTADYISEDLPQRFKDGSALALMALRKLRIPDLDGSFSGIHLEAVQALADDARVRFAAHLEGVRRGVTLKLSEATKELVLQEIMVSQIRGVDPTKAVQDFLRQHKITAFRSSTRQWSMEQYAEMLVRTTLTEAHNTGAATRYVANDVNYARVIERETACKICQPMRNKIIWLGDPRLRPGYHPRCNGAIAPVEGEPDNPIRSPDDPRIPQATREAMLKKG